MSARFSPDGMYYWDGAAWRTTVSPDGRYRWDGTAWVPLQHALTPVYTSSRSAPRQPTSWTRPLQYAVAGWYAIGAVGSATIPFWMRGFMSQLMQAAFQRQLQQNPDLQPPPQSFYDSMNAMVQGMLWVVAILSIAFAVLVIVGALNRWTWLFYLVLVLLGFGAVYEPANLLQFATGSYAATYGYAPPTWLFVVGLISWIPATVLFIFMLIALIKRGPWGMVRATAEARPGATPAA